MNYDIKAIPTAYAGVNFRSRLEARWAAFFDLCGWKWDYEPFDLEGWAPDFRIRTKVGPVLCEVKPVDIAGYMARQLDLKEVEPWPFTEFAKAAPHRKHHLICLLGDAPLSTLDGDFPIGVFDDKMPIDSKVTFDQLDAALIPSNDPETAWREAGNTVQWQPDNRNYRRRRAA